MGHYAANSIRKSLRSPREVFKLLENVGLGWNDPIFVVAPNHTRWVVVRPLGLECHFAVKCIHVRFSFGELAGIPLLPNNTYIIAHLTLGCQYPLDTKEMTRNLAIPSQFFNEPTNKRQISLAIQVEVAHALPNAG